MTILYLEDVTPGSAFAGRTRIRIELARLKAFAAEFGPQAFHLDDGVASASSHCGLAANGWHTAAVTMRILVDRKLQPAGGIVGAGFDALRWPQPTRPGDGLQVQSEALEVRQPKSRPEQDLVNVRTNTLHQDGQIVQISAGDVVAPCRLVSSEHPRHDISQRGDA